MIIAVNTQHNKKLILLTFHLIHITFLLLLPLDGAIGSVGGDAASCFFNANMVSWFLSFAGFGFFSFNLLM